MYAKLLLLKPRTEEVLLQILSLIAEKEKEICSKEKDDDSKPIYLSSKKKEKKKKEKIPDYQKNKNKTKKWTLSAQDVFKLNLAAGGSFV